jgi:hypothetical protein
MSLEKEAKISIIIWRFCCISFILYQNIPFGAAHEESRADLAMGKKGRIQSF